MNNNLVSIIIPVYNVEKYLDRCFQSVVQQTYQELEIILVDDGSSDNCSRICDDWASKDPRIIVIHKRNGGLSDARNAGMNVANGEMIGFVDSDDWIALEMYERLKHALDTDQSDIAACSVEMVYEDGSDKELLTVRENCLVSHLEAQESLLDESKLKQPVWYKLYRRSVMKGICFEKGRYHEDIYWSYQVIGNASRVSLVDYVGYYYWQRRDSIMGENYSLKRLDAIEAYCRRYGYIHKNFPELEGKARRSIIANCIYHGQMAMICLPEQEKNKAFKYLKTVIVNHPLRREDLQGIKATHRLWFTLGKYSLKAVCRIKNYLKVGF